jgi:hypothetical protein
MKVLEKYFVHKDFRVARKKWRSVRQRALGLGLSFTLKFSEYLLLMDIAGITDSNIGLGKGKYCLGRYLDRGGYSLKNCRFITNEDNQKESVIYSRLFNKNKGGGQVKYYKSNMSHYKSKGVISTPWGLFKSLSEAANHPLAECNKSSIAKRINKRMTNYFYIPYNYI